MKSYFCSRLFSGRVTALFFLPLVLLAASSQAADLPEYPLHYRITLQPETDSATVSIELSHDGLIKEIDFNLDAELHSDIEANGELTVADGRALWVPPAEDARLTFTARITRQRGEGAYDALMTDDWAIFRGDNLVPAARVSARQKAKANARLSFTLPDHWTSVTTGWEKIDDREFRIDNPERRFARPTGWMIAGRLGTRVEQFGDTFVAVSAPRGSTLRRMDILTFLTLVWPELEKAFGSTPPELAIIGHGDPMWRGGLSGPNSLFLHADRPLVSENGTSPLVHELSHVVTRITNRGEHDWITEGLAEFYSIELLYRAGAMTAQRRERTLDGLATRGEAVETLLTERSSGAITARAVVLFDALDQEIRQSTGDKHSLDDVVQALMPIRQVALEDLRRVVSELIDQASETLQSPLLSKAAS